jgi:hypothetical protein
MLEHWVRRMRCVAALGFAGPVDGLFLGGVLVG